MLDDLLHQIDLFLAEQCAIATTLHLQLNLKEQQSKKFFTLHVITHNINGIKGDLTKLYQLVLTYLLTIL